MHIQEQVPLAPLTTFKIGGPAAFLVQAQDIQEVCEAVSFAKEKQLPVLILGGGSNILLPDEGFAGLVIQIAIPGIEVEEDTIIAGAGEGWDNVVAHAVKEGLWGVENLSAIPGTVGGAVVQNIGAYGAALSEVFAWADVLDTKTGKVARYTNQECKFDYRDSIFKHSPNLVVLKTALALSKESKPNTSYKDLASRFNGPSSFDEAGVSVDIQAIRNAVIEIRKGKFPDLSQEGTAGSFFKNPIVDANEARALKDKYPDMPLFAMPETAGSKVPLAWLLDHALKVKGASVGGARLYEKQPLVIAAAFGASAKDIVALKEKIKQEVKQKLNLEIEEEVKIV